MQELKEYWCHQSFDCTRCNENLQLSWPAKEPTCSDHPSRRVDEHLIIETIDIKAMERRHHPKRRYMLACPSHKESCRRNEVFIEHEIPPGKQSSEHLLQRNKCVRSLSCDGLDETSVTEFHCECCNFQKSSAWPLVEDAPSRGRRLFIRNVQRTEHD